jgi:hypothetical protein
MKKLMIALAVAAAAGGAFAQSGAAECQLGPSSPAWCFGQAGQQPQAQYNNPYVWSNRSPYVYGTPWGVAQASRYYNNGYAAPYQRTRRDRDGDGIPNRRDRYPDDPRYR